jgi:hypothetical protein
MRLVLRERVLRRQGRPSGAQIDVPILIYQRLDGAQFGAGVSETISRDRQARGREMGFDAVVDVARIFGQAPGVQSCRARSRR